MTKSGKLEWGKNAIMQVAYFLNGPLINLFYCHINLYLEKVTSYMKFNCKSKLYGKFQLFHAIVDGSIKMLENVSISKNFN